MAAKPTYCHCCAEVVNKRPLKLRYRNKLITLSTTTEKKKLNVYACVECDEPMIAQAVTAQKRKEEE